MRLWWWAYALVPVLTFSVTYLLFDRSLPPDRPLIVSDESARPSLTQISEPPVTHKDQARLQDVESAPAGLKQDHLPAVQREARLDDASRPQAVERSSKDEARLQGVEPGPDALKQDQAPAVQREARLEDAARSELVEPPSPSGPKQDLSWVAFYAYSELPPDPRPADIVLGALSGSLPGTPVEEIRRVADVLGLDSTFMKAVAKIESGFNPKQRTGSYIGLFQLSQAEFGKFGSGDIRDPRANAVAGALKMMTEGILFEHFTRRKPSLNDLYLIHQQGVEGATEHISQPNRLAWRSMCATDEGKEKGEKWCKRAIWGNTIPAIKKAWKNVNTVTSAAFVGMWQQRVSEFYARYSAAAANESAP
jgi:hypothetical protein